MKASRQEIEAFLNGKNIAVVGVSRNRWKFGTIAYRELKKKGYNVFAVNPNAETIGEDVCYPNLGAIPEALDGALFVTKPDRTEAVLREAAQAGIKQVWLQQGAQSDEALRFCQEQGISAISGECVLMFAEPAGWLHRAHRAIWSLLGKLPQ